MLVISLRDCVRFFPTRTCGGDFKNWASAIRGQLARVPCTYCCHLISAMLRGQIAAQGETILQGLDPHGSRVTTYLFRRREQKSAAKWCSIKGTAPSYSRPQATQPTSTLWLRSIKKFVASTTLRSCATCAKTSWPTSPGRSALAAPQVQAVIPADHGCKAAWLGLSVRHGNRVKHKHKVETWEGKSGSCMDVPTCQPQHISSAGKIKLALTNDKNQRHKHCRNKHKHSHSHTHTNQKTNSINSD